MLPINWKQTYIRSRFLSSLLGESESRPKNSRKCSMNACIKSHSTIDLESEEDRLVSQACNYLSYLDSIHRSPSLPNTVRSPDCCSDCDPKSIGSDDHFRRRRAAEDELDDDEQLAKDLDFHCLILCSASGTTDQQKVNRDETRSMPFTAEQVLDEIDAWMQDDALTAEHEQLADQMHVLGAAHTNSGGDSECTTLDSGLADTNGMSDSLCLTKSGVSGSTSTYSLSGDVTPIRPDRIGVEILDTNSIESNRLADFGICQLNELYLDLERAIQQLSEVLIQQLALRDELEYEKEQKNTFISLLLGIQAKRRKLNLQRKGGGRVNEGGKHLSTMIPYPTNSGPPDLPTLQVLIKSSHLF